MTTWEDVPVSEGSPIARTVRRFMRHKLGGIGLAVILLVVFMALFAHWLSPYDPTYLDYDAILQPPSAAHWLGTDELGRDIASRIIFGARVSVFIVVISISLAIVVGTLLGIVAGYFGGRIDDLVMRLMDGLQAFPMLALALAIVAALGPDLKNAAIAIAIVNVPRFARLVRSRVLAIRELDYVQAALALGYGDLRIMLRHIRPNILDDIIVFASLRASTALITEAALSFLGLGVRPPTSSWGVMISTAMQYWDAWWMTVFPGLAIFVMVLALNFLGDGLRDTLDQNTSSSTS